MQHQADLRRHLRVDTGGTPARQCPCSLRRGSFPLRLDRHRLPDEEQGLLLHRSDAIRENAAQRHLPKLRLLAPAEAVRARAGPHQGRSGSDAAAANLALAAAWAAKRFAGKSPAEHPGERGLREQASDADLS